MAKQSGLGAGLFVDAYDLSGDVGSLSGISSPRGSTEVTGINKSAFERLLTTKDGAMGWTAFFNKANAHLALRPLPISDVFCTYTHRQSLGAPAASMIGKQLNYDPSRNQDGSLTFAVQAQANSYGLEWGVLHTNGPATLTGAAQQTGVETNSEGSVVLPGTSGNYISTPDTGVLDVTGDIDIRVKFAADDWTPAATGSFLSKYTTTGNQRSYSFNILSNGLLELQWSNDGTASINKSSTVVTGFTDGSANWVRVTLDVDNGAVGNTVRFYTSPDGVAWNQLGADVVTAGVTSIYAGTAPVEVGSRQGGTMLLLAGQFFAAQVRNGIDGTIVSNAVATGTGVTDSTGLVWTVNGTATPRGGRNYGLQHYVHMLSLIGTDATVKLQHSWDNGVADAWVDVPGATVTFTGAGAQRDEASTPTTQIRRFIRSVVTTSAGFTSLKYLHNVVVNESLVSF